MFVTNSGDCHRSFSALHFLLWTFDAMHSPLGVTSNNAVLTRVGQPVWWHGFRRTVCSHRRCVYPSQMSCFRVDKAIAKRLWSTCIVLGDTRCVNRLSQSVNQTCPTDAEAVSSQRRMSSAARIRKLCSTPLDNAYVSSINVLRHTRRIFVELQHREGE